MSGTRAGGLKAAKTNRERQGNDFYSIIGRKGGRNGHTGGFAANPQIARAAGAKGGRVSKRGPRLPMEDILEAVALYNSGVDHKKVAKKYGVASTTIFKWAKNVKDNIYR